MVRPVLIFYLKVTVVSILAFFVVEVTYVPSLSVGSPYAENYEEMNSKGYMTDEDFAELDRIRGTREYQEYMDKRYAISGLLLLGLGLVYLLSIWFLFPKEIDARYYYSLLIPLSMSLFLYGTRDISFVMVGAFIGALCIRKQVG